jgi:hypothetical protein
MQKRNNIIRQIANAMAEKRMPQDCLKFWSTPGLAASEEYMEEVKHMFFVKTKLRQELFDNHGMEVKSW